MLFVWGGGGGGGGGKGVTFLNDTLFTVITGIFGRHVVIIHCFILGVKELEA